MEPSRNLRLLLLYLGAMALALPLFLLMATERFSLLARFFAWLGLALALLPGVIMVSLPRSRMSSVVAIGLALATYHVAVFHEKRLVLRWGEARISDESIEMALLMTALAVPAVWLGWVVTGSLGLARLAPRARLEVRPEVIRTVGALVVLLSLLINSLFLRGDLYLESPRALSVAALLTQTELGFAMILTPHLLSTGRTRSLYGALFALVMLQGLVAGVLLVMLRPLILYLFGSLFVQRRVRLLPLALMCGVVLLLQPVKGAYRQRVWDRRGPLEMGLWERVELFSELFVQHWLPGQYGAQTDTGASVQTAVSRTGSAISLAHVMEMTPGAIPHQYGGTLHYFAWAFIPRVLYPDKPSAQTADVWFAAEYGYLHKAQQSHVIVGLPQVAEAYINFGVAGGLVMLMGLGVLCRVVDDTVGQRTSGHGGLALYLCYLMALMINTQEGSLGQAWGGTLQFFVVYGGLMAVLGRVRRGSAPSLSTA
jgi:hypothetical protein